MAIATIKIEFTPGDSVREAFEEAIRISKALNVITEFDFNGVTCLATREGSPESGAESYNKALSLPGKHHVAFSYKLFT